MKIRMIYLAAGNSRRFGSNKLLYKIDGKPLFSYGLDVLIKVLEEREDTSLTVVTNFAGVAAYAAAGRQRICREREGLSGKGILWRERISIVQSPHSHKGISHSIRAGLLGLDKDAVASFDTKVFRQPGEDSGLLSVPGPDADYYLFCVADQPYISEKTIISLIQK
ncbi:MAG: NTP transferase domain-containing protein, partial [Lachnospiraceae bacterium]|nr:NTP transferase domain-containing protein [Lachnospiraceae bacterium]